MNNIFKKTFNFNIKWSKYIIIGLCINFISFIFVSLPLMNISNKDISLIFLYQYGDLKIDSSYYIINISLYSLNHILLLFALGSETRKDMSKLGTYIFTRTDKRSIWLLSKYARLFIYIFTYYLFQFFISFLLAIIFKFKIIDSIYLIKIIIIEMVLVSLSTYLIIIICNTLSLILDDISSIVIVLLTEYINLFLCHLIYSNNLNTSPIKYMPFVQSIFTWYDSVININSYSYFSTYVVSGFNFIFSFIYLVILIFLVIILSKKIINKMDIC